MAKNYKTENGKHLRAIRSPYDGRVVGWVDISMSFIMVNKRVYN